MTGEQHQVIRFGAIEIDVAVRQIRRANVVIPIEPKPFELLVYLIRNADRVVRRDELMEVLWPGIVVSEATLSSAVRRAREALAPERDRIQGLRKVGYRFLNDAVDNETVGQVPPSDARKGSLDRNRESAAAKPVRSGLEHYLGRAGEMASLEAALADACRGQGRFVVLSGEPGVGKSRTAAELTQRARDAGIETLVGHCYEGEGGQAFWPWVQVFRNFAAARTEAQLLTLLGAEAADIARLTAAVAAPADVAVPIDPEMQRARLLDSVTAVLRRAAQQSPLLLVLEDLHWADTASLSLLRALASHLSGVPMLVVATYRDLEVGVEHPLAGLLAGLRREGAVTPMHLSGLQRDEAAALLRSQADAPVDDEVITAVLAVTEGNPFFVTEYWRDLNESAALVQVDGVWHWRAGAPRLSVPPSVVEVIRRRLQRLSRESVQLLAIAAVIGREFDHAIVSSIATSSPHQTILLLDEAATAGVIDEEKRVPGRYRFVHALMRETLYEGMTALRRAALHRSVGEALESASGVSQSPERIAELAHHFLLAAPAGSIDQAIDYGARAAAEATRACAYDVAVRYLEQAVRLAESRAATGAADAEHSLRVRACELQLELAEALARAGEGVRMRAVFADAARSARLLAQTDPAAVRLLARAAIGISSRWVPEDEPATSLLEEALAVIPRDELALRAQLSARLAKTLYSFDGTRSRREQLCAEARQLAGASGEPRIVAEVLSDALEALFHSDSLSEQDELATALRQSADAADDARLRLQAGAWQIVNSMRHGSLRDADLQLEQFTRLATELRQPRFLHHAAAFGAALLLARGILPESEARAEEALAIGVGIDEGAARWLHWGQIHHVRREQGRFAEFIGEGLALRLPPGTQGALAFQRSLRWAAPHVFCELGRDAEAKASFDALLAAGLDDLPPENGRNTRIPALFSLGDTCTTLGDAAAAGEIYPLLSRYVDQWHVLGWGSVVFASVHLMLGTLSATQSKWARAVDHFEEALRQHVEQRAVCAEARTLFQYARALQRRSRRGDPEKANQMIERGLELADQHGLAGVAIRLNRLRTERA